MTRLYSTKSGSRRWTIQIFFNILDIASVNSWVLFKEVNGSNISRRKYIYKLVQDLCSNLTRQNCSTKRNISGYYNTGTASKVMKRETCEIKLQCNRNRSTDTCAKCNKYVCGKCATIKKIYCMSCCTE